jgi:hypothetical protein
MIAGFNIRHPQLAPFLLSSILSGSDFKSTATTSDGFELGWAKSKNA